MTPNSISAAKAEAMRFLARVADLIAAEKAPKTVVKYSDETREYPPTTTLESAALRRASMDLTRALAKMRNTR